MYSAAQVDALVEEMKKAGESKVAICVKTAEACLGWSYVWGGSGQYCTTANRKSYAERSSCPSGESQQIVKRCQVLNGSKGSCSGCKYYPNGARTRFFDCRGFTRWVIQRVGVTIQGAGATSQYNTNSNWTEKGAIADMPDVFCCVFMYSAKTGKMEHTGLHIGGGKIVHCSGEVKYDTTSNKKWTNYAIPRGVGGDVPVSKPTLRIGSSGEYVVECQNDLIQLGYDLSPYWADGKYGKLTATRVSEFQKSVGLKADGICGPLTWDALDKAVGPQPTLYTVIIPHLTIAQADELIKTYPDAEKRVEGGALG